MPFTINSLTLRTFGTNSRKMLTPEIKNTPEINKHLFTASVEIRLNGLSHT